MKIRAHRKDLAYAIAWVSAAIPKRPAAAALSGIRLTADGDHLSITAFDYDTSHQARLSCEVVTEGEILVSGRFLAMVVGSFRSGDAVELVADDAGLSINCGRSVYRTRRMDIDHYPDLPAFPDQVGTIDADALAEVVRMVAPPVNEDSPHEQTVGIHLETDDRGLWAVGADGSGRAVHFVVREQDEATDLDVTVPAPTLATAVKGLAGPVQIAATEGMFGLRDGSRTVTMRTYAAKYLHGKWRGLLDKWLADDQMHATCLAGDLADAVKRASGLGTEGRESYVGLTIAPDSITISGDGGEYGEGEDVIEAECEVTAWMGFNAGLLLQALAAVGNGPIRIAFPGAGDLASNKPIVITAVDDDDAWFLVAPRRWKGGRSA